MAASWAQHTKVDKRQQQIVVISEVKTNTQEAVLTIELQIGPLSPRNLIVFVFLKSILVVAKNTEWCTLLPFKLNTFWYANEIEHCPKANSNN